MSAPTRFEPAAHADDVGRRMIDGDDGPRHLTLAADASDQRQHAAVRAGDDQERGPAVGDRLALRLVQTREKVVVIQALVILFCGALAHLPRPWLQALFRRRG